MEVGNCNTNNEIAANHQNEGKLLKQAPQHVEGKDETKKRKKCDWDIELLAFLLDSFICLFPERQPCHDCHCHCYDPEEMFFWDQANDDDGGFYYNGSNPSKNTSTRTVHQISEQSSARDEADEMRDGPVTRTGEPDYHPVACCV